MRPIRFRDDSGASLVLALAIVTVFSVIIAAVLTFADTSVRTTMALRDQAAESMGAGGAAEIAINTLRQGTYDASSGQCFGALDRLTLQNFYQPRSGPADSAVVTCAPDAIHSGLAGSGADPATVPGQAVLTLATGGEGGLSVDAADGRDVKIRGDVLANSTIDVPRGSLTSSAAVRAVGACTGTITATPPARCRTGPPVTADPNYPLPTAATTLQRAPNCGGSSDPLQVLEFTPGVYRDIQALNQGIDRCPNPILYFPPGIYYFDFNRSTPWLIHDAYVIGGARPGGSPPTAGTAPAAPGWCQSPVPPTPPDPRWTPPASNQGVQFVFGGDSRISFVNSQVELCASYSSTAPPIVLYGLKAAVDTVPAQGGCVVQTPYPATGCATITSDGLPGSRLYVQGTTYLPGSALDITVNNPAGLTFADGVIARTLRLAPSATANLSGPVIGMPTSAGRQTIVYLTVYLCPGAGTCTTASGTQRLRAKVGISDPTGTPVLGERAVTVYSWSVLR